MAVFPLQVFALDDTTVGYDRRYASSPLNIRYAGQPKGAYVGFTPSAIGAVLTLAPDPTIGYSCVKVGSDVDPGGMDIFTTDPVTLDFTGQPDVDFPMNVIARVQYYADGSAPTNGEIISRSASVGLTDTEALICVVM